MRRLAQGNLNTQLAGAGDRISNLPVTSQPALPPEPPAIPNPRLHSGIGFPSHFMQSTECDAPRKKIEN